MDNGNQSVQEMRSRLYPASHSTLPPQHPAIATTALPLHHEKKGEREDEEIQIDWVTVSTSEEPEQEVTINWEDGTGINNQTNSVHLLSLLLLITE